MAYFSNGSEGMVFDEQCAKCKFGDKPCPIALVQIAYNYDAVNNDVATKILETLVKQDGTCTMWELGKNDFFRDPNQLDLFSEAKVVKLDPNQELYKRILKR